MPRRKFPLISINRPNLEEYSHRLRMKHFAELCHAQE
jgi:hypothetical protein